MTYTFSFDIPVDLDKPLNASFLCLLQDSQTEIQRESHPNSFHYLLKHIASIKLKWNVIEWKINEKM